MKQILVISGKGGTGKTTISGALADLLARDYKLVLADADVDAANLELVLSPEKGSVFPFEAGNVANIDQDICIQCGRCFEVCRFDAVKMAEGTYRIVEEYCEGCKSCFYQCPVDAIQVFSHQSGEWYQSETRFGQLFHAFLYPGEENSGKLVTQIKSDAVSHAEKTGADYLLIDGPPGIGCPVTAAIQGVDIAIIVSEPTVSGIHDLQRVQQVAQHFHIPTSLVINKFDLNLDMDRTLVQLALDQGIPLLGKIPYDERIISAQVHGKPVTETLNGSIRVSMQNILENLFSCL